MSHVYAQGICFHGDSKSHQINHHVAERGDVTESSFNSFHSHFRSIWVYVRQVFREDHFLTEAHLRVLHNLTAFHPEHSKETVGTTWAPDEEP